MLHSKITEGEKECNYASAAMMEVDQRIQCGPECGRSTWAVSWCTRKIEEWDNETESGSCRVNVAVCWAAPEERILHQLQLRPKGLMDKTTQQGSRVRRPLSARTNWSLQTRVYSLWRNTYTCMELLWQKSSIKSPDQGGLSWAQSWRSVRPLY